MTRSAYLLTFMLGLTGLSLCTAPDASAQNIDDPQIKVEFGETPQGLRRAFDIDDGLQTAGRLQLGPERVRFRLDDSQEATLIRRDGKVRGLKIGFNMSTRITVPVKPGEQAPTAEQVQQAVQELNRRPLFLSDLAATAHAGSHGIGAAANARLGEQPRDVRAAGGVPVRVNLGLVVVSLVSDGATTEGGASVAGSAVFDVSWRQGSMLIGGGGGLNLPKLLGGRGLRGKLILKIEVNKDLGRQIVRAVRYVRRQLRTAGSLIVRAAHKTTDFLRGYKGPTTNSSAPKAEPELGAPADLRGADDAEIAARFAPVIMQPLAKNGPEHDFLRRVDFDGDWDTTNNWASSSRPDVDNSAAVYFDVKETESHYYVTYSFFHARRSGNRITRHENDMGGAMVMVRKGAPVGAEVELVMTTRSPGSMTTYASKGSASKWMALEVRKRGAPKGRAKVIKMGGVKFVDEANSPLLDTERTHPQLWVTSKVHSVFAFNGRDDANPFSGKPGVIYHPHGQVRAPGFANDTVGYSLLPMSELDKIETLEGNRMAGDEGLRNNVATLPSGWSTGLNEPGELFEDPAAAIAKLFEAKWIPGFSARYVKREGLMDALDW